MTPMFLGSEPVASPDGTRVFEAEEQRGLALMRALAPGLWNLNDPLESRSRS